MLSTARVAQMGIVAVVAVLALTLGVLVSRAAERSQFSAPAAPAFTIKDLDGRSVSIGASKGQVTVLIFGSARCPVSNAYSGRVKGMADQFAGDARVRILTIETAGDGAMPSLTELKVQRQVIGLKCPTLLDYGAGVAQAYGVEKTPTVCIIDEAGGLRYRGAFDDHRDEMKARTRFCLDTVNALLAGEPTRTSFTEPFGCPIRTSLYATATPR